MQLNWGSNLRWQRGFALPDRMYRSKPRTILTVPGFCKLPSARSEHCSGLLRVPSGQYRGWGYGGVWVWRFLQVRYPAEDD